MTHPNLLIRLKSSTMESRTMIMDTIQLHNYGKKSLEAQLNKTTHHNSSTWQSMMKEGVQATVDFKNQKDVNSQILEAQVIWNMARELGMTWELDQEKIIGRIEEMEERDLKEANKLGARSKNP